MIPVPAQKVPEIVKRIGEAVLTAALCALAQWGVDEVKERTKARREAAKAAQENPE